jgi:translation initiation factor 1 (eIF-1/SUI1)
MTEQTTMARHDAKSSKQAVPEAGHGPALTHNPFGALRGAAAATEAAPSAAQAEAATVDAATVDATEKKKPRGRLVLRRETKRRGGKAVVVIAGLRADAHLPESEIAALAQDLKQRLGCGGAVERVAGDTELVLQGDQPARVAELLRARGFRVDGVTS